MRCGLIDGMEIKSPFNQNFITNRVRKIIKEEKRVEFITIKLPSGCSGAVSALAKIGALLIDAEPTFIYKQGPSKSSIDRPRDYRLKFCKKIDSKPFLSLTKEMHLSRFFLDPKLSKVKASRLWKESIKNHCEGLADRLLIAYFNDKPCGIVTLKFKDSVKLFLHIVAVLKRYQGKNVGRMMLSKIIERYAKNHDIYVETQSVNIPAQICYQKAGFKYHSLKYILHYWRH